MIFDKIKLIYMFIACYELKIKPKISIHKIKKIGQMDRYFKSMILYFENEMKILKYFS